MAAASKGRARRWRGVLVAAVVTGIALVEQAGARDAFPAGQMSSGLKRRHTLKDLRDQYIVKQQTDYSCAAGALATLLTYYFQDETSEVDVLRKLEETLSPEELRRRHAEGFTLLDLKRVAESMGYRAAGFRLTPEQLPYLSAPVIVYVEPLGYQHFAVLRGVSGGHAFVADPARGNLRMSLDRFQQEWNGIIFVLGRQGEESLVDYPLRVPQHGPAKPELTAISRQIDTAIADVNHFVRRSRLWRQRGR